MMKRTLYATMYATMIFLGVLCFATVSIAKTGFVDVPVNSASEVTTVAGIGLPPFFGPPENFYTVFKIYPLVPGKRYEATLTYEAGTDIGYATSWIDGDPAAKDYFNFVGIGTGTGTRVLKNKEDKFIFTIDSKSTSNVLYVLVRSHKPWPIRFAVTDRASGLTRDSQDKWGYYYVNDFDFSKTSPFLLQRGGYIAAQTGSAAPKIRIIGPLAFFAGQLSGTMKLAQISENEGIVWLKIDGTNTDEILNAVLRGNEIKFVRTIDCRFNVPRPYAQVYTGQIAPDGSLSGSYFNDYESLLVYPWRAQK